MIEFISQPWPWFISGPLIAFVMLLLLWAGGQFGVSSTLRTICAMGGTGKKISFFDFDWKSQIWNIIFVIGAIIGGYISSQFLQYSGDLSLSENTISDLAEFGITFNGSLAPDEIFDWSILSTAKGWIVIVLGGFLIGFGTRWAGGCTSGHAISGLSNFQLPSLIAVIGFFAGGLLMVHVLFPLIF